MTKKIFAALFIICAIIAMGSLDPAESKSSKPNYQESGKISGTELEYSGLSINKNGIAVVTIDNPSSRPVTFSATFSFYNSKGGYLTSFTVSGHLRSKTRSTFVEEEVDYKSFAKCASMKVLGRAGMGNVN